MTILALFGFTNCDRMGRDMYGTPHADFVIKGTVENIENNQPIEGIQVKFIERLFIDMNGNEHIRYEITNTNEDGFFRFQGTDVGFSDENPRLRFIDENGVFAEKTKEFDWEDAVRTRPRRGWFSGEFTKRLDVQLTPKQEEENDKYE